jgi:chaperonin cofactor prefoldin
MADVITRLKLESGEYDSKIKRAAQGLQRMEDECRKVGGTLAVLEKDQLQFVQGLGRMETVSKSARGRLGELTNAFTDLRSQYNRLTQEEKQGDFGKALNTSLEQLKVRIKETKNELNSINQEINGSKFGQFGGIIDNIGQKFGVTGNLTEILTSKTALMTAGMGAAAAAIYKATEEWTKYNQELARQDQQTAVITGLKNDDANRMTDTMRAVVDTYNVDFRQAVEAANTLMSQFGETGENATQLIKDGMQGMIQGDGGKLLSMIQQFAPAFRDAGVSASQLVAVIQNSEGGIFTDQNMNAIVMGIKNIRLMTKATSDALGKMGIDGQEMSRKMNDGTMTVFDALKLVAKQLQTVDSNSKTAGEVMQAVFGRQGAMAGTNLAKAIESLNINLEETKKQTGEVGEAFAELQEANEKLNVAIRDAFSYNGWDQMANGIKSKLVSTLATVIEQLGKIRSLVTGMPLPSKVKGDNRDRKALVDDMLNGLRSSEVRSIQNRVNEATFDKEINRRQEAVDMWNRWRSTGHGGVTAEQIGKIRDEFGTNTKTLNDEIKAWKQSKADYQKAAAKILKPKQGSRPIEPIEETNTTNPKDGGGKNNTIDYAPDSIKAQQVEVQRLTKLWQESGKSVRDDYKKQLDEAQLTLDMMTGKVKTMPKIDVKYGNIAPNGLMGKIKSPDDIQQGLLKMKQSVQVEIDKENTKIDTDILNTLLRDSIENGINTLDVQFGFLGDQIAKGINVPDEAWQGIIDKYNELRKQIGEEPIQIDIKTGNKKEGKDRGKDGGDKKEVNLSHEIGSIAGSVNGMLSGIQQLGVELPQGMKDVLGGMQSMISILTSISTIVSAIEAISAADTLIPFARGGIVPHAQNGLSVVPGNHYSGDVTPILANAGEVVLNHSQVQTLASNLQGQSGGGMKIVGELQGEKIVLVANRFLKRSGQGEIVTW